MTHAVSHSIVVMDKRYAIFHGGFEHILASFPVYLVISSEFGIVRLSQQSGVSRGNKMMYPRECNWSLNAGGIGLGQTIDVGSIILAVKV